MYIVARSSMAPLLATITDATPAVSTLDSRVAVEARGDTTPSLFTGIIFSF
jgi:hypothetical protein